jgi:hypothetical protein
MLMKKHFLIILAMAVAITGCSGFTRLDSAAQAMSMSDLELCRRVRSNLCGGIYGCPIDEVAVAEVQRRGLIDEDEWLLIENRKVARGMSECAMRASLAGHPDINRSVGSYGVTKQYVFQNGVYVYVENGKVTGWQDTR